MTIITSVFVIIRAQLRFYRNPAAQGVSFSPLKLLREGFAWGRLCAVMLFDVPHGESWAYVTHRRFTFSWFSPEEEEEL